MKTSHKIIIGTIAGLVVLCLALIVLAVALIATFWVVEPQASGAVVTVVERDIPPEVAEHIESKSDLIAVYHPQPLTEVSSPLTLVGQARGYWYFEADFPVRIEDANGDVLAQGHASAQLDPNDPDSTWMTEDFVPFETELSFSTPTTETGTLVLERANPSGLPENADELRIPVRFAELSD